MQVLVRPYREEGQSSLAVRKLLILTSRSLGPSSTSLVRLVGDGLDEVMGDIGKLEQSCLRHAESRLYRCRCGCVTVPESTGSSWEALSISTAGSSRQKL